MALIELSQIEMEMLRDILKKALSELSLELAFSERKDFREYLKRRREFMTGFVERLGRELAPERREVVSIDRLRKIDLLQGLSEEALQGIAPFFEEEIVAHGMTLCEEGESAERLYVLEEGRVSIRSKKGGQYELDSPGKTVGWSFLVPPFVYTASVVTQTLSKVLVIRSPDFYYVIHREPKTGMTVVNNLAQVIASRLKGPESP